MFYINKTKPFSNCLTKTRISTNKYLKVARLVSRLTIHAIYVNIDLALNSSQRRIQDYNKKGVGHSRKGDTWALKVQDTPGGLGACSSEKYWFSNALNSCILCAVSLQNVIMNSDFYRVFHHYSMQMSEVIFNYCFNSCFQINLWQSKLWLLILAHHFEWSKYVIQ